MLQKFAIKENKISGKNLRLDSTVSEADIYYPTDPHLLEAENHLFDHHHRSK